MRFFTSVHLLLLAYVIAALAFWEIRLQQQSGRIYAQEVATLQSKVDSVQYPAMYAEQVSSLRHKLSMRTSQYAGEGATFLIVILIGAFVVYTSLHRRIVLSRQQNNFMLSVTHELKSPIAAMKLSLQTLEKHQLDEDTRKKLVQRCIKESDRLNDLCNNMLFASQLEGRQYKPTRENFDLSVMAEDAVYNYAGRYPRKFVEEITPGIKITGDKIMIQMVVNNLLENAMKYAPADKPVTITLEHKGSNAVLQVIDEGPGIPDAEKKMIFNKFYRSGNEDTRNTKGTGLGLYLVNKIALQHKGRITVKDNTPSGAIFEICLPA